MKASLLILGVFLVTPLCRPAIAAQSDWKVDFRYQIPNWQSTICLPDDWQKTLVGKSGAVYYDYPGPVASANGPVGGFQTQIVVSLKKPTPWIKQELLSPRVPIVRTLSASKSIEMLQEAFAVTPPIGEKTNAVKPRFDVVLVHVTNRSDTARSVHPQVLLESVQPIKADHEKRMFRIGAETLVACSEPIKGLEAENRKLTLRLASLTIPAGGSKSFCVWIQRGEGKRPDLQTVADAEAARTRAVMFWNGGLLPYDRILAPDAGIQALIESSMRNIYQAREIKHGLPAFQVGPTCYRGLWIVDGAFILEAATYFGCGDEVRPGIMYTLSHQRPDGGFMLLRKYWKESGIVLWTVTRHARLTGDNGCFGLAFPRRM